MHTVHINSSGVVKYPKRIPNQRHGKSQYITPALFFLFLIAAYVMHHDYQQLLFIASIISLGMMSIELVKRLAMLLEEITYLESRYDGDLLQIFNDVFMFKWPAVVSFICSLIVFILTFSEWNVMSNECCLYCIAVMLAFHVLYPYQQLNQSPLYDSVQISTMNGLDVGVGMANSFFHGYLKILLPAGGENSTGIKAFMEIYEAREKIKFINKALYIMIPLSCDCPHRLHDMSKNMEEAACLQSIETDVAGVRNRNYKNSVYKIKVNDGPNLSGTIYVSAEYATPLRTFNLIINSDNKYSAIYKKHKKEILWQFYTTLLELIRNDPSTRGLCEFIYFDDLDENRAPIDIGDVLLKRLSFDKKKTA